MSVAVITVVAGLLCLIAGLLAYNALLKSSARVVDAGHELGQWLRLRHDLVPHLLQVVRGHLGHDRDVVREVAAARSRAIAAAGTQAEVSAENEFAEALAHLLAAAETHESLAKDAEFRRTEADVAEVEVEIQSARERFNDSAIAFNAFVARPGVRPMARLLRRRPVERMDLSSIDFDYDWPAVREFAA